SVGYVINRFDRPSRIDQMNAVIVLFLMFIGVLFVSQVDFIIKSIICFVIGAIIIGRFVLQKRKVKS
ncbi:MAG: hypothetical protein ACRC5C_05495, partial [Bacilli bacterium]